MEFRPTQKATKINRRQLELAVIEYVGATENAQVIFLTGQASGLLDEVMVIDSNTEV